MKQESWHSAVDTDVIKLAVSVFIPLDSSDMWIAFGKGKACRYIGPTQLH